MRRATLEQAVSPGELLIGQPTLTLVRDVTEVEPVEPLALKGKSEPVPAYRLLGVRDVPERRHETRFVGRERELAVVRDAWDRTGTDRRCELVTIVGDPGIGKSRLAAVFLASIDATVVRGRCPPYGDGITFWPLVEVVREAAGIHQEDPPEAALAKIRVLLDGTENLDPVTER